MSSTTVGSVTSESSSTSASNSDATSSTTSTSQGSDGGSSTGESSTSSASETSSTAGCGNGELEEGEQCDTAIPAGEPGACPSTCDDDDLCTADALSGEACAAACTFTAVAPADDDSCCPPGAGVEDDNDCKVLYPLGPMKTICKGLFHVPTIAAAGERFAIGCLRSASQKETPVVKFIDSLGDELASIDLLTTDGNYYNDIQVSHHDGRIQVIYQYNCDDNGSWNVGWGWGCIDFREYDTMGTSLTPSVIFGEIGHNGHPVLDWTGDGFGVSWVSYDDIYFRGIDKSRMLVGGGKGDNVFIAHDPLSSDDRNGARTHMVWDGSGHGIFSIIGGMMYFTRTDPAGQPMVPLKLLTPAFSQHFSGQFTVIHRDDAYFVVFADADMMGVSFMKVSMSGDVLATTSIIQGFDIRFGDMFEREGLFYVLTNDAEKNALVTVLDDDATILEGKGGTLGEGPMVFPVVSYDPSTEDIGVAFLSKGFAGSVMFQRFSVAP